MKILIYIVPILVFVSSCVESGSTSVDQMLVNELLEIVDQKTRLMIETDLDSARFPRSFKEGKVSLSKASGWTSGFYPGILWRMYGNTGNQLFRSEGERFLNWLEPNKELSGWNTHDLGFMMLPEFGKAYELTNNQDYKQILLETADSLANLYNPTVGTTLSWPWRKEWSHPTIIDNLLNLELLFWSAKNGGDKRNYDVAVNHLNTTMKHHIRPDYSTYHVINYDAETGEVISKVTDQGAADSSTWSRGQAWAVYGYTMGFRETGDSSYLATATKLAEYYISQLPDDKIPYWDFSLTGKEDEPRDVSSLTIFLSAYIDLTKWSNDFDKSESNALIQQILTSLKAEHLAPSDVPYTLDHSTGSKPHNGEISVPLIYADYYLLEALLKLKQP